MALIVGCSGDGDSSGRGVDPAEFEEGRFPVPGCEGHDFGRCDVRSEDCQARLYGIAECLRGSPNAVPSPPPVTVWSESEAERDWLAGFAESPRPDPDHFEIALRRLGLTVARALQPEEVAARLAREIGAFYHLERKDIVFIDHPEAAVVANNGAAPGETLGENALLLHEMIHALQDRDHDLIRFNERYRVGFEADLRGNSVIEGEATFHMRRYLAARAGLDLRELDLELSFDNLVRLSEQRLMSETDLYSASDGIVPYAHGGAYVLRTFEQAGQEAIRALFDEPPKWTRDVLAVAWHGESATDVLDFGEAVDPGVDGVTLEAWTPMGAWGVYLLGLTKGALPPDARRLALAWRGDQLRVFGLELGQTAAIWEIELADADAAQQLAERVSTTASITVEASGARLTLVTATADVPDALLPF